MSIKSGVISSNLSFFSMNVNWIKFMHDCQMNEGNMKSFYKLKALYAMLNGLRVLQAAIGNVNIEDLS